MRTGERTSETVCDGGTGESLITMWSAHNLHPRIPYGDHRHCHDVYEAHAATLWGIHTYASAVHID